MSLAAPFARNRYSCFAIVLVLLASMLVPGLVHAAESGAAARKVAASLKFVPADVSFYGAMLRNREKIEIIGRSKAWAKFKSLPAVKSVWEQVDSQWQDGSLSMARQIMSLPENEQLMSVLTEMVSQEIFVYGDEQCGVSLELASQAINAARYSGLAKSLRQAKAGKSDDDSDDDNDKLAGARAALDTLADNLDAVETPGVVIGFKLKDRKAAETQLKRLEVLLGFFVAQIPDLKDRFQRKKIGDGDYLTLELDGGMVPWDQVPFDQIAEEAGQYDDLTDKLKGLKLAITLGLRENFVLLSIAESNEHLAVLGTGDMLADAEEFEPLAKFADQRVAGLQYLSEDIVGRLLGNPDDLDQLSDVAEQLLAGADADEALQKSVLEDVALFATDLKAFVPEPGPMMSFAFLTPRGIETYGYNWSENVNLDGSQKLGLLEHVGGSPLAAIVGRSKVSPRQYELLVKWLKKAYGYVDKLAVPQLKDDDKKQYEKAFAAMRPLLERLDKTTSEKLIPSLMDGQTAVVFDGKLTSKQWHRSWPQTETPMPMAELALVLGVSDAKLLKAAMTDYMAIADEAIVKIRELNPEAIPAEFKLPRPQMRSTDAGETFAYPLPAELGVDSQIVPNAGLNKNTAVLSLSLKHSARLLAAKPFKGEGPLADLQQARALAIYLDWAALVGAVTPWIDLAVETYGDRAAQAIPAALGNDDDEAEKPAKPLDKKALLDQVHDFLAIVKVLRSVSSATYLDDDLEATVQHSEAHFQDLP